MMYVMVYIALIAGAFIGWVVFRGSIEILLTALVFVPYSSKSKFNNLYSLADDEASYNLFGVLVAKNYADYLRLHEASKKSAYKHFRKYYSETLKLIILRVAPIALLPAILFWGLWYWYVLGVVLAVVLLICYKFYVDRKGVGYYQRGMIFTIIDKDKK